MSSNSALKLAQHEWRSILREPRFLWPFAFTSLLLVGLQAYLLSRGFTDSPSQTILLARPMLLLLGVLAPGLCVPLAADSFAGERERHTFDLLLCLPVAPRHLFLGKVLGIIPFPLFFGWFGQGLLLLLLMYHGVPLLDFPLEVWGTLIFTPCAVAFLGALATWVSLRSETVRGAAQALSPLLFLAFLSASFLSGFYFASALVITITCALLLALAAIFLNRASQSFFR